MKYGLSCLTAWETIFPPHLIARNIVLSMRRGAARRIHIIRDLCGSGAGARSGGLIHVTRSVLLSALRICMIAPVDHHIESGTRAGLHCRISHLRHLRAHHLLRSCVDLAIRKHAGKNVRGPAILTVEADSFPRVHLFGSRGRRLRKYSQRRKSTEQQADSVSQIHTKLDADSGPVCRLQISHNASFE